MAVRRGDLVTIALQGDYGKPRPALIIQSELFAAHPSMTVLPITSDLRDAPLVRVLILPNAANGLRMPSQVMIDKTHTVSVEKVGAVFGRLSNQQMLAITQALIVFLGLA